MLLLPLNPATVNLQAVADAPVVSGTVRVFSIVSGSEVDALGTTSLSNPYDNLWRYLWAPSSLAPGNYTAYYRLTDSESNVWTAADDLVVSPELTLIRKFVTNRWRMSASAFTMTFFDDDGTTPLPDMTFDLLDQNGNPSVSAPFERVPT